MFFALFFNIGNNSKTLSVFSGTLPSFVNPPSLKFSLTVSSEKILRPSKTCAIPKLTIFDGSALVIS